MPSSPSTTDAFLYDGEGQRVEQQVTSGLPASPSTTTTVYLGNIAEVQTAGTTVTTTTYYYAGTQRIAIGVNGTFSYVGSDLLGSATVALDASGNVAAAQLYAPYGTVRYSTGTMPGSYGFTGQRSDAAVTGLDYYGARYYDPAAGQFSSADSVLPSAGYDPWSLSRYAYVAGNPETHVDADGHCWPLCTMIVGALIGAAVSAASSVVTQAASGQGVDWGQVGKEAAVGAVAGAVSGLAGPEAGPLVRAAVDTGASVASQVASNALDGKPLGDGVGMAALSGAMASVGLGAVVEAGGSGVSRLLGRGVEDAEGEAATVAHDAEGDVAKGDVCARLSFAANTPVTLSDGSGTRPIAALHTGDRVLAYDPSTGTASSQPVERVYVNHDANLVDVTLVANDKSQAYTAPTTAEGKERDAAVAAHGMRAPPAHGEAVRHAETIHTTTNHPWYTADHGWLPAGFLRVGERVVRADGGTARVAAVRAVVGAADMWDLTVGVVHTFSVGNGRYVVHNCGSKGLTSVDELRAQTGIPEYRNIAYADSNLEGAAEHVHAGSGDANPEGWLRAPQDQDRVFQQALDKGVPTYRRYDSEIKILEHYAGRLEADPNLSGTIDMFTERAPCTDLCSGVIDDFRNRYGSRVTLNVLNGGR